MKQKYLALTIYESDKEINSAQNTEEMPLGEIIFRENLTNNTDTVDNLLVRLQLSLYKWKINRLLNDKERN